MSRLLPLEIPIWKKSEELLRNLEVSGASRTVFKGQMNKYFSKVRIKIFL